MLKKKFFGNNELDFKFFVKVQFYRYKNQFIVFLNCKYLL